MANVRLVSAGSGKEFQVPDNITIAELRELSDLSPDVSIAYNGEVVHNESDVTLSDGDTVIGAPRKVGHGSTALIR